MLHKVGTLESLTNDAHKVFQENVNLLNFEISKLFLGQTSTMDEKSFSGSAEVHERVLEGYEYNQDKFIEHCNNDELVPLMASFGMLSPDDRIEPAPGEELSVVERSKIDIELLKSGKFTFSPEYLKDTYKSDVIPVEQESSAESAIENVKNLLKSYYE